jgi:hypothetical protein
MVGQHRYYIPFCQPSIMPTQSTLCCREGSQHPTFFSIMLTSDLSLPMIKLANVQTTLNTVLLSDLDISQHGNATSRLMGAVKIFVCILTVNVVVWNVPWPRYSCVLI